MSRHSKRERLLAHLSARFDKPRFRVYAWSGEVDGERVCLVGWSTRSGDALALSEALLALRLRDGARCWQRAKWPFCGFRQTGSWGPWALIEAHGIVVPLEVPGGGQVDDDDWRECWRHRVMDPVSNHKRVPMTGGPACLMPPRAVHEPGFGSPAGQLQAAKRADLLESAELAYQEALARKGKYLERVKRGLEAPMPLDEYRAWADEVRALGVTWARLVNESLTSG